MKIKATLRRTGGSTMMTVPAEILRAYRLGPGDAVVWDIEGDEAKVVFLRVRTSVEPAEKELAAAE
jgi:antitoxin component of MazEF toxin-antitoxin module